MSRKIDQNTDRFIREVAKDRGITEELSDKDIRRAHDHASRYRDPQDYYDALKEFFSN